MVIEIEGCKYELVSGGDCRECAFYGGTYCGLNHYPDMVDLCEQHRGHWEEVEDEDNN